MVQAVHPTSEMGQCEWCKETRPSTQLTWFVARPGKASSRICDFCYEEARKQLKLVSAERAEAVPPLTD